MRRIHREVWPRSSSTRHRTKLTADQTRYKNRILKEVESSGIKLASVCSDVLGKTGRALLDALLAGKTVDGPSIEALAQGSLKKQVAQLLRAVQSDISPSSVFGSSCVGSTTSAETSRNWSQKFAV